MNQPNNSNSDAEPSPATLDQEEPESVSVNRLLIAGGIVAVGLALILLVIFTGGDGGSGSSENQNQQQSTAATVPEAPQGETFLSTEPAEERDDPSQIDNPPGSYQPTPEFSSSTPAGSGRSPAAAAPTGQNYPQNYRPYRSRSARSAAAARSGPSPEEQRFQEAASSDELLVISSAGPNGSSSGSPAGGQGATDAQAASGGSGSSREDLTMQEQVNRRMRQLRQRYASSGSSAPGASGGSVSTGPMNLPPSATPPQGGASAGPSAGTASTGFQRRMAAGSQGSAYYRARVTRPRSRYEIDAGTVVPAVLMTAINSELPGSVVAQVSRDVYDSASQQHVLIPKGSKLIGGYDDQIATGQSRATVAWTRIIFPDGRSIQLPGLNSKDLSGASGLSDEVNRHYARVFGSAIALSAIGAGFQLSQPRENTGFGSRRSAQQVVAAEVGRELSRVATEMIRQNMDIQPTIKIRKGYRFYVFFNKDLAFPAPYRPAASGVRFERFDVPVRRQVRGRVGRFPQPADSAAAPPPPSATTARSSNK